MYEKLTEELRNSVPNKRLMLTAADAIEELQKQLREEKVDNVNLTGWLAEEHANQCPHYTRNVHDRGDDSLCDKWVCEVKSLPKWIPVAERLPQDGAEVLAWSQSGFAYVDWFIDGKWKVNGLVDGKYEFVTHWMPLPPPPKGTQDED